MVPVFNKTNMSSYTLFVDSSKWTADSTSSTNFQIQFPGNFPEITQAELKFLMLPLSTYTISAGNNVLYFYENSTNKTATINPGNFSGNTLASLAQDALNTSSGGYNTYTVSYSNQTFLMTFSATNPFVLRWSVPGSPNLQFGFQSVDTASSTSVMSTQVCNLTRPLVANISIPELDGTVFGSSMFGSTFLIPLKEGSSYTNVWEPLYPMVVDTIPRYGFNRLTVRLTHPDGSLFDLGNMDWCFTREGARKRFREVDQDHRESKKCV
jgi:hypothetical protein